MADARPGLAAHRLADLHAEVAELAFVLDRRGRRDAADVAQAIGGRIAQIRDELAGQSGTDAGRGRPESAAGLLGAAAL